MNDKQTLPHPLLNTRRFFLVENVAQLSEEKNRNLSLLKFILD